MRAILSSPGLSSELRSRRPFSDDRAVALGRGGPPRGSKVALSRLGVEPHRYPIQGRILSDDELFSLAKSEKEKSQAKVSGFRVGAAGITESGRLLTGHNLEISDRLTIGTCAESSIAFQLREEPLKTLLITSDSECCVAPCGGCRQTLSETAPKDARIIMTSKDGAKFETTVGALLPMPSALADAASIAPFLAAIDRAKELHTKAETGGRKIARHGAVVVENDGTFYGGATRKQSGTMSLAVQMAADARFLGGHSGAPSAVVIAGTSDGPHGLPVPTGRERQELFNLSPKTVIVLVNPETGAAALTSAEQLLPFAYSR